MGDDSSKIDLVEQRALIRRGTRKAHRVLAFNLGAIVLLALLALGIARKMRESAAAAEQNARRANEAERQVREELYRTHVAQAKAERVSGAAGHRQRALDAIKSAAKIRQTPELLDEAVATLATFDLGKTNVWHADHALADDPAFSRDLERVVILQDSRHFTLSRTRTREVIHQFEVPEGLTGGFGFSPDGRWLVAYSQRQEWLLWDTRTFELRRRLPIKMNWEYALRPQFSPDSRWMILCEKGRQVKMVELAGTGETTISPEIEATKARPDPSFHHLAIVGEHDLLIWNIDENRLVKRFDLGNLIGDVAWHPQGHRLGLALSNGNIVLLDWETGVQRTLIGHNSAATHIVFHPSGNMMVSTSWDGSSRFWDTGTGRLLFATHRGLAMDFDPAGRRLAFVRDGSGFGVWDVETPVAYSNIHLPLRDVGRVLCVAFSPDETLLASCDESAWYLHDATNGRLLHQEEMTRPRTVLFSHDGLHILVSGWTGLHRFQLHRGTNEIVVNPEPVAGKMESETRFERAAQTPDGRRIVVVGRDKGYLLDGGTLQPVFKFGDGFGSLVAPAISPDGKWIAASTWKGAGLFLWNGETQKLLGRLMSESSLMAFSPAGDRLVTSNLRGFQIWNPNGWKLVHQESIEAGSSSPGPVTFHPDGSLLAIAANRQGIGLVDPSNGRRLVTLNSPDELNLSWLAFSSSGHRLAAATEACDIHLWDLETLKQALGDLGLVWPTGRESLAEPEVEPSPAPAAVSFAGSMPGGWSMGIILVAMVLAISFAGYSLLQHRRLTGSFEKIEQLAEQQRRDLVAAELELQQGRKMQALGTLAAGVAHDFNNLLSVISLSNDFLHRGIQDDLDLNEETEAIARAVSQGRQVIESMLGYSRHANTDPREFDLCELVEDAVGLLGQQFLSGIRLTLELDRALKRVAGHRGKVEQILLNLIVNAGEAMNGRGRLLLGVRSVTPENLHADVLAPTAAGAYLELRVQDDGPGIPPEVLPRVFEPFFTTKNVGAQRGTGLGLSTLYTIAEKEGYGIDLESAAGQGTTFRIIIPLLEAGPTGRESPSDSIS